MPVNGRSGSTDDVKHELSPTATIGMRRKNRVKGCVGLRVPVRSAGPGSVPLKVVDESGGVASKINKVNCFSALPQQ